MTRQRKKLLLNIAMLSGVAMFAVAAFWEWAFPHFFVFDTAAFSRQFPATRFTDCRGTVVHTEPGYDYCLRFPVKLEDLPQHLIDVTLAAEDRNFFEHDGVDLCAVARAAFQLITNGRIVSGASTVSMQLVNLAEERRGRSLLYKLAQMGKARNLERRWSKKEILEEYFNRLPYGGKIYGIEAAANYYFGLPAGRLNTAESILLAGIPQRPNRLRPDRFPEAAIKRRDLILEMLVRQGSFSEADAERIRREPLRFRDFSLEAFPRADDPQFFLWTRQNHPELRGACVTTLDMAKQSVVRAVVTRCVNEHRSVHDGAAIVIENRTRSVRAFLGTTDFKASGDGQVNAVLARRSPGSLLKPFIFGEAINGGLLVAETLVDDSPLALGDYRPENFSGDFLGRVSARGALSQSLNTPAVRILNAIGTERCLEALQVFGIRFPENTNAEKIGLSLALGGAETTLWQLAGAYCTLASGSVPADLRCTEATTETSNSANAIWNAGTAAMVLEMLQTVPLPGAEHLEISWKTGTSNGLRDAWCIAVTPEWTVAVWFGNKDGSSAPELVGAEIAAPVTGAIMNALYRNQAPAARDTSTLLRTTLLCGKSGLAAGTHCEKTFSGTAVVGIPLRTCPACKSFGGANPYSRETQVLQPLGGVYRKGFNGKARFILKSLPAQAHWYLDGSYLGFLNSGTALEIPPGKHQIYVWGGNDFSSAKIEIEVK